MTKDITPQLNVIWCCFSQWCQCVIFLYHSL